MDKAGERARTATTYNMRLCDGLQYTRNQWEMPIIHKADFVPSDLVGFNYALSRDPKQGQGEAVHFYLDDYQFERIWREPERYTGIFKRYGAMLTPDFSLYRDMKAPQQIYNTYRARLLGAYYQKQGVIVIPSISWSTSGSFDYCFDGIEKGSIVAISSVGVLRDEYALLLFKRGVREMVKRLEPAKILLYGSGAELIEEGIEIISYKNHNSGWRAKHDKV